MVTTTNETQTPSRAMSAEAEATTQMRTLANEAARARARVTEEGRLFGWTPELLNMRLTELQNEYAGRIRQTAEDLSKDMDRAAASITRERVALDAEPEKVGGWDYEKLRNEKERIAGELKYASDNAIAGRSALDVAQNYVELALTPHSAAQADAGRAETRRAARETLIPFLTERSHGPGEEAYRARDLLIRLDTTSAKRQQLDNELQLLNNYTRKSLAFEAELALAAAAGSNGSDVRTKFAGVS